MTGHFVEYFTTALKTVGWKTGGHTVQKNLYETVVDELGWTVKPGKIPPPYHMGLWLAVIVQYGVPNSCSMHIGSQILKHAEYSTDCCLLQEKQQNDSNCQVKVV